ncbi:MAG: hypothetical protein EPN67_08045 [Pusillimonas sp.]|nr:MAG: hypothetical protein EPN67_08045 [Pusillimonas sp.]
MSSPRGCPNFWCAGHYDQCTGNPCIPTVQSIWTRQRPASQQEQEAEDDGQQQSIHDLNRYREFDEVGAGNHQHATDFEHVSTGLGVEHACDDPARA